jgi:hypothetical protein
MLTCISPPPLVGGGVRAVLEPPLQDYLHPSPPPSRGREEGALRMDAHYVFNDKQQIVATGVNRIPPYYYSLDIE